MKQDNRGGARAGAGAKPKADKRQSITFRLPPDQIAFINSLPARSAGKWIEDAINIKRNQTAIDL